MSTAALPEVPAADMPVLPPLPAACGVSLPHAPVSNDTSDVATPSR
jgi:hypothetical protein